MKKYVFILLFAGLLSSCGNSEKKKSEPVTIGTQSTDTKPKQTPTKALTADDMIDMNNKGVGVIKSVTLGEIDLALATRGEEVFNAKDRKSTRLNSSHVAISYAVFCLKK